MVDYLKLPRPHHPGTGLNPNTEEDQAVLQPIAELLRTVLQETGQGQDVKLEVTLKLSLHS
jgi:hypothetical protein